MNERVKDSSIRIKVHNSCQWTCVFCHNEGTELPKSFNAINRRSVLLDPNVKNFPQVENMRVTSENIGRLINLQRYGIDEVHLTGGEPTLLPELPELINSLSNSGYTVKLTSNGQFSEQRLKDFVNAGLGGINFSILSLDSVEFLKTQSPPNFPHLHPEVWASNMIAKEKKNIIKAKELGLSVKINTIFLGGDDEKRVDTVREFAEQQGIELVLLPSIEEIHTTGEAAFRYVEKFSTFVGIKEYTNNSKGSRIYRTPSGNTIRALSPN